MNDASFRPVVGITTPTEPHPTPYACLPAAYSDAVARAGGMPIVLDAARLAPAGPWLEKLDGILFSGGSDINPLCYEHPPQPVLGRVDHDRDTAEIALLRAWLATGKPLLGIGRGAQLLMVAEGGTLVQDIASGRPKAGCHLQIAPLEDPCHTIRIEPGSTLSQLLEGAVTLDVNSAHHQAIDEIAPGYRASARAVDGIVEAVEAADGRAILGVQWHPEAMEGPAGWQLVERFIAQCRSGSLAGQW